MNTTPGIREHKCPTIALVTTGVKMDVLGIAYHEFTHEQRDHVCGHHPHETNFRENIIEHFANGIIKKPSPTSRVPYRLLLGVTVVSSGANREVAAKCRKSTY